MRKALHLEGFTFLGSVHGILLRDVPKQFLVEGDGGRGILQKFDRG